jgi:hypothetical protein
LKVQLQLGRKMEEEEEWDYQMSEGAAEES